MNTLKAGDFVAILSTKFPRNVRKRAVTKVTAKQFKVHGFTTSFDLATGRERLSSSGYFVDYITAVPWTGTHEAMLKDVRAARAIAHAVYTFRQIVWESCTPEQITAVKAALESTGVLPKQVVR